MVAQPRLTRSFRLGDTTLLIVGCIVGVGIFRTASPIAAHLQSPALILLLWVIGGAVSMCGALCYAELAAMFPASGGDYVYITKIYGRFWGFLFGWCKLFVERTGTIAILGLVFAEYTGRIVPLGEGGVRLTAVGAIILLTGINVFGIRWGKYIQNSFTLIKIAALGVVIAAGVSAVSAQNTVLPDWSMPPMDLSTWQAMGVAFVFVLWSYGGWTEAGYVAEEVYKPSRNVPRAIILGVLGVTVLYLFVNWTYLLLVPVWQLPDTPLVASTVMYNVRGHAGAVFISWMVACSAFGALNGYILTGGRLLYAIGKDHALFHRVGTVHPTYHTPAMALWANAAIASILILVKSLEQIMIYSTVAITIFFIMAVWGVIVLRRSQPNRRRPYRAWGYPYTPVIFCLTMVGFLLSVCLGDPEQVLFGLGLLAIGVPLYWFSAQPKRWTLDGPS